MCAMSVSGSQIYCMFTVFDVLYFDWEGKGVSDGLFDGSDVLRCITYVEMTYVIFLCGSKCLRRVCAGFAQG